jgi:lysozyme
MLNSAMNWIDPWGLLELSSEGLLFIAGFEGYSALPYNDVANNATIGYGHLLHYGPVTDEDIAKYKGGISEEDALKFLDEDTTCAEKAVDRLVNAELNQNQFDAIVSFTYNVGQGNLRRSNLLRLLNNTSFNDIATELLKWTKAGGVEIPGLLKRRSQEAIYFYK